MTAVAIAGAGVVTALGDLSATWSGLMAGDTALAPLVWHEEVGAGPVGCIADLGPDLGSHRRLATLTDRLLADLPVLPAETAVVVATTKGAIDELLVDREGPWSGQPWDLAGSLRERLAVTGSTHTISAACASGTLAIIHAVHCLLSGQAPVVLVVGIDLLSRFVLAGFASLQALSRTPCRPFDRDRDGLSLGEGGGWLVLATDEVARRHGWPLLGHVAGWGAACDAGHITAPCREASGLKAAINQATGGGSRRVGAINAHGTGTRHNDAMELRAFGELWGEDGPPIHSVKGAIGHCLGGAGVIEAAIALETLRTGQVPPTVGVVSPESRRIQTMGSAPSPLAHPSVLSCNSGFGGINAAILLRSD